MIHRVLCCCVLALSAIGCANQVTALMSERGVAILREPTKVEVYRIKSPSEQRADKAASSATSPASQPGERKIAGYPLIARGKDQDAAFAKRLAAIFLDAGTFDFNSAKGCMFDPGVVFRVFKGADSLDLVICFHCREFKVIVPQVDGTAHQGSEDFDNAYARLLKLTQEALPGDAAIRSLGSE